MKLSVVMPSHNVGSRIHVNILNASLMGMDDVEVIIRDNSGNEEKRKFLSQIHEKNCRIILVDECSALENLTKVTEEAKGEFVFFIGDDDFVNSYALPSITTELDRITTDPSIIGTTGVFIRDVGDGTNSRFVPFDKFNVPLALDRFRSFFTSHCCHSIFQYSPLRRDVLQNVLDYASSLPVFLSYHDWIMNCLFLMHGKLTYVEHFLYQYIDAHWSTQEACTINDAGYFRQAGLDTSGLRLQWLIAIFEGAQTYLRYTGVEMPRGPRQELAAYWMKNWLPHFHETSLRQVAGSKFEAQAIQIAEKWKSGRTLILNEILLDIADFYALSSPAIAQRYYDFWK